MTGRVLVVEDDDDLRRLLSLALRSAGHSVEPHATAGAAVRAIEERPVDVVVTDLRCPAPEDGRRVVRSARSSGSAVVVVSGSDEAWDVDADVVLLKPVDVEVLAREVDRLLRQGGGPDAVAAFVGANAGGVRERAIVSLGSCSTEELPDVVHRLVGTLGSFGLSAEADVVRALVDVAPEEADAARRVAVARLTTLGED